MSPLPCFRAFLLAGLSLAVMAPVGADTGSAASWFEAHRDRPPMLRQFLQRMPKGGELHSHLHGAVYAETYLDWAGKDHYCVDRAQRTLVNPPCTVGGALVSAEALDTATYNALLDRMSTRNLAESGQSGHDRFFESFSVFGRASGDQGLMAVLLAEVTNRAAAEHLTYLELIVNIQGGPVDQLADELARSPAAAPAPDGTLDFAAMYRWLLDHGLQERVAAGRAELDRWDADYARLQGCGTANPAPGCVVGVRWLQQSGRNKSPPIVFGRLAFAFALAQADPRVVGLNLVGPEDDRVALRDYGLQMQMLRFLSGQVPGVKVALHAGELTLGLVPPEALRGHVREAVTVGGARRIGHGVDIGYEDGALDVLKTMRAGRVAVEVCLTSNDLILDVTGRNHPLADYLATGVPVVLASDDQGVSRIDLTNEYQRAAREHGLSYRQLKQISRNGLTYSFLPGDSLWLDPARAKPVAGCARGSLGAVDPAPACRRFLAGSEKAREQWRLEAAFTAFEDLKDWRTPGSGTD